MQAYIALLHEKVVLMLLLMVMTTSAAGAGTDLDARRMMRVVRMMGMTMRTIGCRPVSMVYTMTMTIMIFMKIGRSRRQLPRECSAASDTTS